MPTFYESSLLAELDFIENSASIHVNQLLGERWSAGVFYTYLRTELDRDFPELPRYLATTPESWQRTDLHRVGLQGLVQHPSGWFAGGDASWFFQDSEYHKRNNWRGYRYINLPDYDFPMVNLWVGWRLPWRQGEITVGLLNATDEQYQLNLLSGVAEMPRERTVMTRFRFLF